MLSKQKTFDVRTVDFNFIVNILRNKVGDTEFGKGLLETIDVFGMNMICVDELDANGLNKFDGFLKELAASLEKENKGLSKFLAAVCAEIELDERVLSR
ncbi:hypothetical Protein YC6258_00649 [Gynuella sunshinyii YC6258]|uniref:Uncharacterized protein n=2 Tax=Gynuella sunshinyii TaxID=1445505 RepID=A0A0C5VR31_9GAMM|nr:hypothetical Protein YC6258_00649 [Gynuella sunshinyii YC6258]